jgi:hypothetical protein
MSKSYNKGLKSFVALTLALSLGACSSSGSSDSETSKGQQVGNTNFSFSVENPSFDGPTSQVSQLLFPALNYLKHALVSDALAADAVLTSDIYIVRVNTDGEIVALIQPTAPVTQQADNSYKFSIAEGGQSDIVILIDINQKADIALGKKLNAANYLYHPVVDDKAMVVDLGSSAAFDIFIEEIDDFSKISSAELDRIIDSAQERLIEVGLEEQDYTSLLASIRSNIMSQVETNTALAVMVDDTNVVVSNDDATIEEDRASIKAFFDEANTLYSLQDEFVKFGNSESSDVDTLASQGEEAGKALEQAQTALQALSQVELVVNNFIGSAQVTAAKQTRDISSLFAGDSLSQLTGTIEYDQNGASIIVNGRYDQVIFDQLTASVATNGQNANLDLSGTLESPTAKLVISKGEMTSYADLASAGFLLSEQTQEIYADKINALELSLELTLTTKTAASASFSGELSASGIRSTDNYIKYVGGEAEPIFNLKQAKFKGELRLAGNSVALDLEFTSPNAATFVPNNQTYEAGKSYQDIVSYSYNGDDKFEIHLPMSDHSYLAKSDNYTKLFVEETGLSGNQENLNVYIRNSFIETIQAHYIEINGTYYFSILGADLDEGAHRISKEVYGKTFIIDYNLEAEKLTVNAVADEGIIKDVYTFNADQTDIVVSRSNARNVNQRQYHSDGVIFSSDNHSSLTDYVEGLSLYVQEFNKDCYSTYYVDTSLLVSGESQPITVNKSTWDYCPDNANTVNIKYSLTTEEFIFDIDNKFNSYKKYSLHSLATTAIDSIVRTRTYLGGYENIQTYYLAEGKTLNDYLTNYFELENNCVVSSSNRCGSTWFFANGVGSIYTGLNSLEVVDHQALTAFVSDLDSPYEESENNFRLYDVKANIEVQLNVLGTTNLEAEVSRTGYNDMIISLSVNHSDLQQAKSGLTILITNVSGKTDQFVVLGSTGMTLNLSDYEKEGNIRTLVYGKETATITRTDIGLKLTFSDGTFYNY